MSKYLQVVMMDATGTSIAQGRSSLCAFFTCLLWFLCVHQPTMYLYRSCEYTVHSTAMHVYAIAVIILGLHVSMC